MLNLLRRPVVVPRSILGGSSRRFIPTPPAKPTSPISPALPSPGEKVLIDKVLITFEDGVRTQTQERVISTWKQMSTKNQERIRRGLCVYGIISMIAYTQSQVSSALSEVEKFVKTEALGHRYPYGDSRKDAVLHGLQKDWTRHFWRSIGWMYFGFLDIKAYAVVGLSHGLIKAPPAKESPTPPAAPGVPAVPADRS